MRGKWGNETKFAIAQKMLYQMADSIQKSNPNVELALRIFGHQSHRDKNNCTDTKLEVAFTKNAANNFRTTLNNVKPQGHTPIAYSLYQSADDFPDSENINSIILITDGLENCEGNPCEASAYLKEKRITINPYIIGLDIADSIKNNFDCIGTFINAKDETTFEKVLQTVVKETLSKTTLEVNLLTFDNRKFSNIPIIFYDHFSVKCGINLCIPCM